MPSTRTPEGEFNRCGICGCESDMEPSYLFNDATCPACGHLLRYPAKVPAFSVVSHKPTRSTSTVIRQTMWLISYRIRMQIRQLKRRTLGLVFASAR